MKRLSFAILKNETEDAHLMWAIACEKRNIDYDIIDLTSYEWLDKLLNVSYGYYLACPSVTVSYFKTLYDERIYILEKIMGLNIYPSYQEISIHENKRFLSYWLKANNLPHTKTYVFYNKVNAINFINQTNLPIVTKINIGASGSGVKIFRSKNKAKNYIEQAFLSKGVRSQIGPNLKMGRYIERFKNIVRNPAHLKNRIKDYITIASNPQKHFVIFQEYIHHDYEWRVVKIGDSYFGHQKVKKGDKASGTKGIDYILPPVKLLNFVRKVSEKFNFNSMAFDLFEDGKGGYLINELQTIFGHVQEYICEKNGNPGRLRYLNGKWVFEEGNFNTNLSYDLRLQHVIDILNKGKK